MVCATSACFPSPIAVVSENTPPRFGPTTSPPASRFDIFTSPVDGPDVVTRFNLTVDDPDPEPLQLRFFLDQVEYNEFPPFGLQTTFTLDPTSDGQRFRNVVIPRFCDILNDLATHTFEAWVTDTTFQDTQPLNEVTEDPETGRKGTRDVIKWVITCRLPAGG